MFCKYFSTQYSYVCKNIFLIEWLKTQHSPIVQTRFIASPLKQNRTDAIHRVSGIASNFEGSKRGISGSFAHYIIISLKHYNIIHKPNTHHPQLHTLAKTYP